MKEIGSEFWDVPVIENKHDLFPEYAQWFLSGRSGLQAIIKETKDCRTVAMPSWCCDSMIKPFVDTGFEVHFYPVYWQNGLIQEISFDNDELFLMDYFGYTISQPDVTGYKGIIIRDVTHSLFSSIHLDADYYFGSLRKWCGIWTGGYVWTKEGRKLISVDSDDCGYTVLRRRAMDLKSRYINGKGVMDKSYLRIFDEAEDALKHVGIATAAERDIRLARRLDIESIRNKRRANAAILRTAFSDWLIFPEMSELDCPMFVPILVPDGKRDDLRQYLMEQEIYCPIHWPVSGYHHLNEKTKQIYDNELSLVCDQRYTEEDMYRIVETIRNFWRKT